MTTGSEKRFLWGATLSAHCVEGGNFASDWWPWEQRPGRVADTTTSQAAADHASRWRQDYQLASKLGLKALTLGVEWSRVEPESGRYDVEALEQYAQRAACMRENGIAPIGVLQAGTLPLWLARQGGWLVGEALLSCFRAYVERALDALGDHVRYWIPIYQANQSAWMAYVEGLWPPAHRNALKARRALDAMAQCQKAASELIHDRCPDAQAGVSVLARLFEPYDPHSPWDLRVARWATAFHCRDFVASSLDGAGQRERPDFVAVGCFGRERLRFRPWRPRTMFAARVNVEGRVLKAWAPEPDAAGLQRLLVDVEAQWGLPVLVAGNGLATDDDVQRRRFLLDHIQVVQHSPVNVIGYLHHAFLDGFEWEAGYTRRNGLVYVDRATLARTPNPSAYLYKDVIEAGAIRPGAVARHCPDWRAPEREE